MCQSTVLKRNCSTEHIRPDLYGIFLPHIIVQNLKTNECHAVRYTCTAHRLRPVTTSWTNANFAKRRRCEGRVRGDGRISPIAVFNSFTQIFASSYAICPQAIVLISISMNEVLVTDTNQQLITDTYEFLKKKYSIKRLRKPTQFLNGAIRQLQSFSTHITAPRNTVSVHS